MIHALLQCIYCFTLFLACNRSAGTRMALLCSLFKRQYFRKQPIGQKKPFQNYSGLGKGPACIKHDPWAAVCVLVQTVLSNPTNTLSIIHLVRTNCEPWIATGWCVLPINLSGCSGVYRLCQKNIARAINSNVLFKTPHFLLNCLTLQTQRCSFCFPTVSVSPMTSAHEHSIFLTITCLKRNLSGKQY